MVLDQFEDRFDLVEAWSPRNRARLPIPLDVLLAYLLLAASIVLAALGGYVLASGRR